MVYEANFTPQKAVDEPTAAMMSWMLQGVVQAGTGIPAQIGRPVAGKTGTSDESRDLWSIGYIPQVAAGVTINNRPPLTGRETIIATEPLKPKHSYYNNKPQAVPVYRNTQYRRSHPRRYTPPPIVTKPAPTPKPTPVATSAPAPTPVELLHPHPHPHQFNPNSANSKINPFPPVIPSTIPISIGLKKDWEESKRRACGHAGMWAC